MQPEVGRIMEWARNGGMNSMSDEMAKGCNNCPARSKCEGLTYRGSDCAALRHRYGASYDPEIHRGADDLISRKALMEGRVENDPVFIAAKCAPAVDPHEHGRWIMLGGKLHCSNCEDLAPLKRGWEDGCTTYEYTASRYCPNCGVKMDGGEIP